MNRAIYLLPALLLTAGCAQNQTSNPPAKATSTGDGAQYVLAQEPGGAKPVLQVREEAKDGDAVVLVGRIGGTAEPWMKDRAGFFVIDPSLKPCNEREDDDCPTPWDYCCDAPDEKAKAMATVKVVDAVGKTVPTHARELLKVKELDTVVVQGKAKRDAEGNLTILASGVYRK